MSGNTAIMEDGRVIRLAGITDVHIGDYLEVYADIAMGKVDPIEARDIQNAQIQKGTII